MFVMQAIDGWKYIKVFCGECVPGVPWEHRIDGSPQGTHWSSERWGMKVPKARAVLRIETQVIPKTASEWIEFVLEEYAEGVATKRMWSTFLIMSGALSGNRV